MSRWLFVFEDEEVSGNPLELYVKFIDFSASKPYLQSFKSDLSLFIAIQSLRTA